MTRRSVTAAAILMTLILAAGCGSSPKPGTDAKGSEAESRGTETAGPETVETTAAETEPETEPEMLVFHNQAGDVFSMEVRGDLKKHDYNFDNLKGDGITKTYTDEKYQSRLGVDLSRYQDTVNWDKLKQQGIEFVILRIGYTGYSEGAMHEDPRFEDHYEGARLAGMDIGAYWFSQATTVEEAEDEAGEAVAIMEERELELPIFFDEEFIVGDKGRADELTPEQLTANAEAFCSVVKELGYEPGVYCDLVWQAEEYDMSRLQDVTIWYADYDPAPQTPYDFDFWQFTRTAKVEGLKGDIDLNLQFIR